jgi:arsenate reductase
MAEGWTRHLHGSQIEAFSAGTEPKDLDPFAVKVMAEVGVDISGHRSKHLSEVQGFIFDRVFTVCGQSSETCPVFLGHTRVVHHGFDDPPGLAAGCKTEEEALKHYRFVRDEIRRYVEKLPVELAKEHCDVLS